MTKYELVGRLLESSSGRIVDVGARDRVLARHLPGTIAYHSADLDAGAGHDLAWDLEEPLPAPDRSWDFVSALDVLEHLEHLHEGLDELMRITKQRLFISLPNLASLSHRLAFFVSGTLGGKYTLGDDPVRDRHRWIPAAPRSRRMVRARAARAGFAVIEHPVLAGYGRLHAMIARLPLPPDLTAYTNVYELVRLEGPLP